ncbi:MAG: hypothetical protein JNK87_35325 [Bryobacterales bacterium]|nr:hypothetical protein [Bryobacterales bacterium]
MELTNRNRLAVYVEARFGSFELMVINQQPLRFNFPFSGRSLHACGRAYKIYSCHGKLAPDQLRLLESGAIEQIFESFHLRDTDEFDVSQNLVRTWMDAPTPQRVMAFINAVADFMPHLSRDPIRKTDGVPAALLPLVPLLDRWAISDDEERSRKLAKCAPSTRERLVRKVVPLLPVIDEFLASFGNHPPEQVCEWGDLAQAAIEAQSMQ